jgi:aminoglycoside 2''-phosphotransferase
VNDEIIFCFPSYTDLAQEIAILKSLRGHMPLAIPDPVYVHLAAANEFAFYGYPQIPGEITTIEHLEATYDSATCDRLASQIGQFLKTLHNHPLEKIGIELSIHDGVVLYTEMYEKIKHYLFSRMRPDAREQVTRHFENYLNSTAELAYTPALRHGDFGLVNVLFDPKEVAFTAVINFGDADLGDPAVDFAGLYGFSNQSATFARRMFAVYPELEAMTHQMHFHRGTFALQEALFGAEHHDDHALAAGLENFI